MRPTIVLFAVMSVFLGQSVSAKAVKCGLEMMSQPPVQQATLAEIVVIGKVTAIEPDMLIVEQYPGGGKVAHLVATIRIEERLSGGKGVTHLRVGFVPTRQALDEDEFGLQPFNARAERSWRGHASLSEGQEACFFLRKHATADFHVMSEVGYPLNKSDVNYDNQIKAVRKILKACEDPIAALKTKDAADRQLFACALVLKYRSQSPYRPAVATANQPIPAEESELILKTLAEMKWGEMPFDENGTYSLHTAFQSLQIAPKDGWQQPAQKENEDYNQIMNTAASKWLKDNAGKYRIQKLVATPTVGKPN